MIRGDILIIWNGYAEANQKFLKTYDANWVIPKDLNNYLNNYYK